MLDVFISVGFVADVGLVVCYLVRIVCVACYFV